MDISKAETDHPPPRKYTIRKKGPDSFTLTTDGQEGADQLEVDSAQASLDINLKEPAKVTLERLAKLRKGKLPAVPLKK